MKLPHYILAGAIAMMLVVMFVLPFFSDPAYSMVTNTTSQLGAQFAPNAWVMNATFMLLGFSAIVGGWQSVRGLWFHRILLVAFGVSLFMTGIYSERPIALNSSFDLDADRLHSLFATVTGFAFTILAIATSFALKPTNERVLAVMIGTVATLLSVMMFRIPEYAGIWQRIIFISSFGWLLFAFYRLENGSRKD